MSQGLGNLTNRDANIQALRQKQIVPTPSIFLPHYAHVNEALRGEAVLYDASGNLIEEERLRRYGNKLNNNCWVHLNTGFKKGTGFLGLDLAVITGLDDDGNPVFSSSPLEDCLEEDCYADLESLNTQGFPTTKTKLQKYIPGKVIYFWRPYKDSVAWFYADSFRALFDCDGDPLLSDASLGVFLCAEGAQN